MLEWVWYAKMLLKMLILQIMLLTKNIPWSVNNFTPPFFSPVELQLSSFFSLVGSRLPSTLKQKAVFQGEFYFSFCNECEVFSLYRYS